MGRRPGASWIGPVAALAAAAALAACAGPPGPARVAYAPAVLPNDAPHFSPGHQPSFFQTGTASWYGDHFKRRPTASGERFNPKALTAAHRSLPLQTIARVINLDNGRMVLVRINDRGPYVQGRIIDLSRAAAAELGMKGDGVAPVRIEVYDSDQVMAVAVRR